MQKWERNYLFPLRCYLDSEGRETDKQMRFVDMAIEVDSHIRHWNDKDSEGRWIVDKDREFNLIYSLCLMLASKGKMCTDGIEYDEFAFFLAYDVFDKIERPRNKDLPIKSVLNYIKSIIKWRLIQFRDMNNQRIYDPVFNKRWGDGTLKNSIIEQMENAKNDMTIEDVHGLITSFPRTVYSYIPLAFKKDKVIAKYIYLSSCLTLIDLFSNASGKKSAISLVNKPYTVIMYRLDYSYFNVVKMIINKSLLDFAENVKSTIDKFKVGDFEYNVLMNSVFGETKNEDIHNNN